MVDVTIYLREKHDPIKLVELLLTKKLIANASIDRHHTYYTLSNEHLSEETYNVITVQSKALLFNDLAGEIESIVGEEIPLNATPIVASNSVFNEAIKSKTKAI